MQIQKVIPQINEKIAEGAAHSPSTHVVPEFQLNLAVHTKVKTRYAGG